MITTLRILRIHDRAFRDRRKCTECGLRRLTTQVDLEDERGRLVVEYLCNECLTRTPPWSS